jgi:formylglycine-generating enzyme required for sulfatase activity
VRTRPGTVVDVRDYLDRSDDWLRLGTAPLDKIRVPAGYLAWRASSGGQSYTIAPPTADTTTIDVDALAAAPPGMVPVRAQRFFDYLSYFGWLGPYDLPPFFIDRVEVTNRDFQKFVDAGGYRRAEFWPHPFTTGGRTLSWAQAMDRSATDPGQQPTTWEGGHYREGAPIIRFLASAG